jgi:hypothetical protein
MTHISIINAGRRAGSVNIITGGVYRMGTLENYLEHLREGETRRWPRIKCNYTTECSNAFGHRWTCNIVDLSERGLGLVSSAKLRQGETVHIADPKTKARVVWVEENRAGLNFCN